MGTRGGRPEPQAVASRRGGRNAARGPGRDVPRARASGDRPPAAAGTAPPAKPGETAGPPRWYQLTTLVLALLGLGVSVYLTITHYTDAAPAACPENATFNCVKVTTSPESMVFGIFPVAVLGLAFYVFMVAVTTPWAWRAGARAARPSGEAARAASLAASAIPWARLAGVIIGIAFILYLIYVELFVVNAICLWCTSVHVVTFVLFAFVVGGAATWGLSRPAAGRA